eukprot:8666787-Pyramimonas_sp.AAC.1
MVGGPLAQDGTLIEATSPVSYKTERATSITCYGGSPPNRVQAWHQIGVRFGVRNRREHRQDSSEHQIRTCATSRATFENEDTSRRCTRKCP